MTTGPRPGANRGPAVTGQEAGSPPSTAGSHRRVLLAIAGLTVLCALGCLLAIVAAAPSTASGTPAGLPITVCAGVAFQPRFQAGVVWVSPISSYLPPVAASSLAICVRLPFRGVPGQPWREWVFPP
jgi:hypothetical protein